LGAYFKALAKPRKANGEQEKTRLKELVKKEGDNAVKMFKEVVTPAFTWQVAMTHFLTKQFSLIGVAADRL